MTGPEHYREAEKLLRLAAGNREVAMEYLAAAQVNATLALAAALGNGHEERNEMPATGEQL